MVGFGKAGVRRNPQLPQGRQHRVRVGNADCHFLDLFHYIGQRFVLAVMERGTHCRAVHDDDRHALLRQGKHVFRVLGAQGILPEHQGLVARLRQIVPFAGQKPGAEIIVGIARVLQGGGGEEHRLVVQHPVDAALVAVGGHALIPGLVEHPHVGAGGAGLQQLLNPAQVVVENGIIPGGGLGRAEGIEAVEHRAGHPVAGPFRFLAGTELGAPYVPDDTVEACGVLDVGFHQVILVGVAMAAHSAGFGGQDLVLQLGPARPETVNVDLVILVQVFRLGIIHGGDGLGDFQVLAVADLGSRFDAHFMEPGPQGRQHPFHIQLGLHVEQVVLDAGAFLRAAVNIVSAEARMIVEPHFGQVDEQVQVGANIITLALHELLLHVLGPEGEAAAGVDFQTVHEHLHVALFDLFIQFGVVQDVFFPVSPQGVHARFVKIVDAVGGLGGGGRKLRRALLPVIENAPGAFSIRRGEGEGAGAVGFHHDLIGEINVFRVEQHRYGLLAAGLPVGVSA